MCAGRRTSGDVPPAETPRQLTATAMKKLSWKVPLSKRMNYTPLLILLILIILTQTEAMGARLPSLAVAAPIASFWISIVTYLMHNIKRGVYDT